MESIGQTLRKSREAKRMTVAEVAQAAKAKVRYIEAIEKDDLSVFPAPIYAQGFIRLYAECVGLDPQPLIQACRKREATAAPGIEKGRGPVGLPLKPPVKKHLAAEPMLEKKAGRPGPAGAAEEAEVTGGRSVLAWLKVFKKIAWSKLKNGCLALSAIRLPVETWKTILSITGLTLLVLAAVLVLAWHFMWKNEASASSASRWLAEPPPPYLNAE